MDLVAQQSLENPEIKYSLIELEKQIFKVDCQRRTRSPLRPLSPGGPRSPGAPLYPLGPTLKSEKKAQFDVMSFELTRF